MKYDDGSGRGNWSVWWLGRRCLCRRLLPSLCLGFNPGDVGKAVKVGVVAVDLADAGIGHPGREPSVGEVDTWLAHVEVDGLNELLLIRDLQPASG